MQKNSNSAFGYYEDLFACGVPKLVPHPATPDYSSKINHDQESIRRHVLVFKQGVKQQLKLPAIRSFLKLYRSIGLKKLASFENPDKPDIEKLRRQLTCLKQKVRVDQSQSKSNRSFADVHFWLDDTMVHIDEEKRTKHFGGFFIHHLEKLEGVVKDLEQAKDIQKKIAAHSNNSK